MHTKAAHTAIHSFKYMAPGFPCTKLSHSLEMSAERRRAQTRSHRPLVSPQLDRDFFFQLEASGCILSLLERPTRGHRPAEKGAAVQMGTPLARPPPFLGRPSLLSLVLRGSLRHVVFFF